MSTVCRTRAGGTQAFATAYHRVQLNPVSSTRRYMHTRCCIAITAQVTFAQLSLLLDSQTRRARVVCRFTVVGLLLLRKKKKLFRSMQAFFTCHSRHPPQEVAPEPVAEEQRQLVDAVAPGDPRRYHRNGDQGAKHSNESTSRFSFLKTCDDEPGFALERVGIRVVGGLLS